MRFYKTKIVKCHSKRFRNLEINDQKYYAISIHCTVITPFNSPPISPVETY